MTTLAIRAALASLLAASLSPASLLSGPASASTPANCDWYARTALKQQLENEQRRCGQSGSNWSTDLRGHLSWCQANPDQFRAEAQRREQVLAACKK